MKNKHNPSLSTINARIIALETDMKWVKERIEKLDNRLIQILIGVIISILIGIFLKFL
ncbi:MAG: hypothetical protein QXI49_05480 [Candidatus Methanomethylicaceae archaeon]